MKKDTNFSKHSLYLPMRIGLKGLKGYGAPEASTNSCPGGRLDMQNL